MVVVNACDVAAGTIVVTLHVGMLLLLLLLLLLLVSSVFQSNGFHICTYLPVLAKNIFFPIFKTAFLSRYGYEGIIVALNRRHNFQFTITPYLWKFLSFLDEIIVPFFPQKLE